MATEQVKVHLLLADHGTFHETCLTLPSHLLESYPRLIDAFLEDPDLQKRLYVDLARLSAAWLEAAGSPGS